MSDLTTEKLRTLAPHELAALLPATVWIDGCAAVVIRTIDAGMVEVYLADRLTAFGTQVLYVEPLFDAARSQEVLGEAAALLAACRQSAIDTNAELIQAHAAKLDEIRDYAIGRHEDGDICRDGLDSFLSAFGFLPYLTRVRISYTITGHYDVQNTSESAASEDAEKYLRPDLTGLDDVDDYSTSFDLMFDATEV